MVENQAKALLVATMDTKGQEAGFIRDCLEEAGLEVLIMDAGIKGECPFPVTVKREEVALAGGRPLAEVRTIPGEGEALAVMTAGAVVMAKRLFAQGKFDGLIGLGGSMGTTLCTAVMRAFPIGLPKVMITTMASRDTRGFVAAKDIMMLHAVADLSGLNRITRRVLSNGANALAGMLLSRPPELTDARPVITLSTLGTTETCAQTVRRSLEETGREVVVFHTVGAGGQAMEEMIQDDEVAAVVDLSLHEMVDHRFGGDYDAGPDRGAIALRKGLPTVIVPGNIDFLVTGPLKSAQARFPGRAYHIHNAAITAVRTARQEILTLAQVLAEYINAARGPVRIFVPLAGLSAFDQPGGPLHDPEAPALLAEALDKQLDRKGELATLPCHVNDPLFAQALIDAVKSLL